MRQTKWLERRRAVAVAAVVVGMGFGMLHARDASSEPQAEDGAPSGMVAFVGGGDCPPGWLHASDIEGRAIVGTVIKEDVGVDVGTPFTAGEERVHEHAFTGAVNLPAKYITAVNGVAAGVALAGTFSVTGVTDKNADGLPFFQMEGCIKP
ncbi:MAG: hypothetical protein IPM54_37210 [Polyangiaceae bacterium]|nr:hypothetical protein [Polyangiaceae bacterium]